MSSASSFSLPSPTQTGIVWAEKPLKVLLSDGVDRPSEGAGCILDKNLDAACFCVLDSRPGRILTPVH